VNEQLDVWQCIAIAQSEAAPRPVSHAVRRSQELVLALLHELGPSTDDELFQHAQNTLRPISPSTLALRRGQLVKAGLVTDTGLSRRALSGRRLPVWRAS
jgi:hypothetical protein